MSCLQYFVLYSFSEFWTVLRESDLSIDKALVLIFTILEFGSKVS